ncbi:MAG: hypothetical protein ACPGQS_15415 [Bradymonadia bacterium]
MTKRPTPYLMILIAIICQHAFEPNVCYGATQKITKLRAELLTDAPIMFGIGGLIEVNNRWRLATSIGVMPRAYVELSNQTVMLFPDAYTEATATLIEDTIQNSLVWSISTGWSPKSSGFFAHAGYRLSTLGGGASAASLIEGLTGVTASENRSNDARQEQLQIDASATLHMLSLEFGWEWTLVELERLRQVTLRAALGWSYTFHSTVLLSADDTGRRPQTQDALNRLERAGESYLVDTFDSYVHPPTISLALGYQWN